MVPGGGSSHDGSSLARSRLSARDVDKSKIRWVYRNGLSASGGGADIISSTGGDFVQVTFGGGIGPKISPLDAVYNPGYDYTSDINRWCNTQLVNWAKTTQRQSYCNGTKVWEYSRVVSIAGGRVMRAYGFATAQHAAKSLCDFYFLEAEIHGIYTQGETDLSNESNQAGGSSQQVSNTIVASDDATVISAAPGENKNMSYVSSEPTVSVSLVTNRYMPLQKVTVSATHARNHVLAKYDLPRDLYAAMGTSVNLIPFQGFIYGKYSITMKFVVNSNAFQSGKIVASVLCDSYQCPDTAIVTTALTRPHAVIDLTNANEVEIVVPFTFRRSLVRNVQHASATNSVYPAHYATVTLMVLSPLTTGLTGATDAYLRPFVRFDEANFAGMSYRVDVQMDTATEALKAAIPTKSVRQVLKSAEALLDSVTDTPNRDKPSVIGATSFVPQPRCNFATGKGLTDVKPLRVCPYAATPYVHVKPLAGDPKTVLDIARIWGLRTTAKWSDTSAADSVLVDIPADPTCRWLSTKFDSVPTPLEYVASMYQFWSGTIEVRVDVVGTAMHVGSLMLSAEFGRPAGSSNTMQHIASTYTKVYDVGADRSVTFTIPYIYDTVWRRSNAASYRANYDSLDEGVLTKAAQIQVRQEIKTRFRISVVNPLRPVETVAKEIELLVFWRASPSFMVHGLCQQSYVEKPLTMLDNFPVEYVTVELRGSSTESENAVAQMDVGDKETPRPTHDFNVGAFNLGLQTTDSQLCIKDILRRPVLLMDAFKITGYQTSSFKGDYWLPIMPPSRMFAKRDKDTYVDSSDKSLGKLHFNEMIGQTPQAALMNLFRSWRGSLRYTIIAETTSGVLYVTHLGHTGVRRAGVVTCGLKPSVNKVRHAFGAGLSTEILIPSVNPVIQVEVPYDTENDWTLVSEADPELNYHWRDKGDTNAGHLVLSSPSDFVVTIWVAAGDDFEVANFIGMPHVTNTDNMQLLHDAHSRTDGVAQMDVEVIHVQADFISAVGENLRSVLPGMRSAAVPIALAVGTQQVISGARQASQSAVTATNAFAELATDIRERLPAIDQTHSNLDTLIVEARGALETSMVTMGQLANLTSQAQKLVENLVQATPPLLKLKTVLVDIVIDILSAALSKSWWPMALGTVRLLARMWDNLDVMGYARRLCDAIMGVFEPQIETQAPPAPRDNRAEVLCGVLVALSGTICGIARRGTPLGEWPAKFLDIMTSSSGLSYINQVMRFVSTIFACLKDYVLAALGLVSPEVRAIRDLCEKSSMIQEFVTGAQQCSNMANSNMVGHPSFRTKFWRVTIQAYQIQKAIIAAGAANVVSPMLGKLVTDHIKLAQEKFVDLSCSPVTYEPIVIAIEGPSAVGKSFFCAHLVRRLLESVRHKPHPGGDTYIRSPGAKHWNGYNGQPFVIFDDFMNMRGEESKAALSELFLLKSPQVFHPPMAELAEKKISANPLGVIILTNRAFPPDLPTLAMEPNAVLRRRDILIRTELAPGVVGNVREMDPEVLSSFGHLVHGKYANPTDPESLPDTRVTTDKMIDYLCQRFQRYHAQETLIVRKRTRDMLARFSDADEMSVDPFEMLYRVQTDMVEADPAAYAGYLPSEQLARAVEEIVEGLAVANQPEPIVVPDMPSDAEFQLDVYTPLSMVLKACVLPLGLTSRLLDGALGLTIKGIEKLLEALPRQQGPIGECSICCENVELYYSCSNGTGETGHNMCRSCGPRWLEQSRSCPVCRSPELCPLTTSPTGLVARFLVWLQRNVARFRAWVITLQGTRRYRIWLAIAYVIDTINMFRHEPDSWQRAVYSASSISHVAETTFRVAVPLIASSLGVSVGDGFGPMSQADVPEPQPRQPLVVELTPEEADMLRQEPEQDVEELEHRPTINERNFDRFTAAPTWCNHQLLIQAGSAAQYMSGIARWRFPHVEGPHVAWMEVEDGACSNHPDCPLRSREVAIEFVVQWATAHRSVVHQRIIDATNRGDADPNSLPLLLRPLAPIVDTVEVPAGNWWDYLSDFYSKHKTLILVCTGVITITAGVAAVWSLLATGPAPQAAMYDSAARQMRRQVSPRVITRRWIENAEAAGFQSEDVDTPSDAALRAIVRNFVLMKLYRGGEVVSQVNILGIAGRYAIFPKHYLSLIMETWERITIEPTIFAGSTHMVFDLNLTIDDIEEITSTDIAFVKMPASFPLFKDIRRYAATQSDLEGPCPARGSIILAPTRRRVAVVRQEISFSGYQRTAMLSDPRDSRRFECQDLITYDHSEAGACGSIVLCDDHQRPIRGMHVAGTSGGVGYAVLLPKELLDQVLERSPVLQYEDPGLASLAETNAMVFDSDVKVDYLGVIPPESRPFMPQKSKIRPSVIAPALPPAQTAPAILSTRDKDYVAAGIEHSPLWHGAAKHGKVTTNFTTEQVARASKFVWDAVVNKVTPLVAKPKVLTIEEAITGFDIPYYEALKLDTSAGYPWATAHDTTKRSWCSIERDPTGKITGVTVHEKLRAEIERKAALRKQGVVPATVFVDTLKDERRKLEKRIKPGGTRIVCASPIDYTIAMRQMLLHFTAAFMSARLKVYSAVGINAKGTEWTELYQSLVAKSPTNIVTMDYSNFGPGFNAVIADAAAKLIVAWCMKHVEGANELEIYALITECTNSLHLMNTTVYRQFAGSPSGAAFTTIMNTIVNLLYLAVAWEALAGEKARTQSADIFAEFVANVFVAAYGDDFIMAVTDKYKGLYNANTLVNFFAKYGIAATTADKALVEFPDTVPISQASFLKRSFLPHPTRSHYYLGPLEADVVEEIPKWVWSSPNAKEATRLNVASALMEAHGHGERYFNRCKAMWNTALGRAKISPVTLQWSELDNKWFTVGLDDETVIAQGPASCKAQAGVGGQRIDAPLSFGQAIQLPSGPLIPTPNGWKKPAEA